MLQTSKYRNDNITTWIIPLNRLQTSKYRNDNITTWSIPLNRLQTSKYRNDNISVCWQHRWFTAGCGLYKTTTAMKFLLFLLLIRDTVCLFYFLWLLLLSFLYLEVWSLSEEWFMLLCYVILFDHYYLTIYFPPRYNWNIIESGVKHYNSNPNYLFASCKMYFMEKLFFFFLREGGSLIITLKKTF
jgi:hypothetical protein